MQRNTIPKLLDALRPSLAEIGRWAGAQRALTAVWQQGTYQPKPDKRRALVAAVRKHAARLLKLAEAVEREGEARAADAGSGDRRGTRRQPRVSAAVPRGDSVGSPRERRGGRDIHRFAYTDISQLEVLHPGGKGGRKQ